MIPTTASPRAALRKTEDLVPETISAAEFATLRESMSYLVCIFYRNLMGSMDKRTMPYGISASQWRFLRALYVEEGSTQRELSHRVGLREPTTVRAWDAVAKLEAMLTRLERDGLVKRVANTSDKRKVNVFLTQKARKLVSTLLPSVIEVNEMSITGFSKDEERMLKRLLIKAVQNLDADQLPPAQSVGRTR